VTVPLANYNRRVLGWILMRERGRPAAAVLLMTTSWEDSANLWFVRQIG
jgi:hypothetical protein